eukprot:3988547-Amphidinium_carterae.2
MHMTMHARARARTHTTWIRVELLVCQMTHELFFSCGVLDDRLDAMWLLCQLGKTNTAGFVSSETHSAPEPRACANGRLT